jgi:ferrous iron transport protein A
VEAVKKKEIDMFVKKKKLLTGMRAGESGTVVEIAGGMGALRRLQALGIRVGKKITKTSEAFMRGPVTVKVGGAQIGIGYGMASKIIVEEHP